MKAKLALMMLSVLTVLNFTAPAFAVTAEEKEALKHFEKIPMGDVGQNLKSLSCLASNGVRIRYQGQSRTAYASFGLLTVPLSLDFHFYVEGETVYVDLSTINPFAGLGAGKMVQIELFNGLPENGKKTVMSGTMMAADIVMTPIMPLPIPRLSAITCSFVFDYNLAQ